MENMIKSMKDNRFFNTCLYIFVGVGLLYIGIWVGRFLNQGIQVLFK